MTTDHVQRKALTGMTIRSCVIITQSPALRMRIVAMVLTMTMVETMTMMIVQIMGMVEIMEMTMEVTLELANVSHPAMVLPMVNITVVMDVISMQHAPTTSCMTNVPAPPDFCGMTTESDVNGNPLHVAAMATILVWTTVLEETMVTTTAVSAAMSMLHAPMRSYMTTVPAQLVWFGMM